MDTTNPPPIVVNLDDADTPADVVDALLLGPFVAGTQPISRSVDLERVRPDAPLLPAGTSPARVATSDSRRAQLAQGPGWTLRTVRWKDATATVTVVAETDDLAASVLAAAVERACEPESKDGTTIPIAFWHRNSNGRARRSGRDIATLSWSAIRSNYPREARAGLERIIALRPDTTESAAAAAGTAAAAAAAAGTAANSAAAAAAAAAAGGTTGGLGPAAGRLLLLHGPPGTGKTTALRAIAGAWRKWCQAEVVIDSERLYGDSDYLMSVLLGHDPDDDEEEERPRWRLLILEDCDELIRANAKKEAGQALGRLLNVTDGLIGQGLRLLVAITTNEPLGALHPAIVRPGRCLAEIHIGKLSRAEAMAWLGSAVAAGDLPFDGATLAELYELRGSLKAVRPTPLRAVTGMYL